MSTQQRFVRNLASGLLAGAWTAQALRDAVHQATGRRFGWAPALVKRLLSAHAAPPRIAALLAFLEADKGFQRALAALASTPNFAERFPVWRLFPAPPAPPLPRPVWAPYLPEFPSERALAEWLDLPLERLLWLADPKGRNTTHCGVPTYRYRWVAKARGNLRCLEIPLPLLKNVQRKLLTGLLNCVPVHPAAHGFRPQRSALTNAAAHCGRAVVLRFDLSDFFPSVPVGRVFRMFLTLGYSEAVARLLSGLCTTRLPSAIWNQRPNPKPDGSDYDARVRLSARHLPQGAPTSPALANLIAFRLDRRLAGLAKALGATYTRYADDLTFSGDEELRRGASRLARRVTLIAAEEGFRLNRGKTKIQPRGTRQLVTGLVVNVRPNTSRQSFDLLKAILTNCARHGPESQNRERKPDFQAHLAGRVAHVAATNATRGRKLWALFDRINWGAPPAAGE